MMEVALVHSLSPALSQREAEAKDSTITVIDGPAGGWWAQMPARGRRS